MGCRVDRGMARVHSRKGNICRGGPLVGGEPRGETVDGRENLGMLVLLQGEGLFEVVDARHHRCYGVRCCLKLRRNRGHGVESDLVCHACDDVLQRVSVHHR